MRGRRRWRPRRHSTGRTGPPGHRHPPRPRAQPQGPERLPSPTSKLTVITGVSGSGKSTLAFDILFDEGQRRYLESLNAYARQFVQPAARADVDAVFGIPPTVAIEQRTSRGGHKSTVGTLTEIHHYLRLLYVKLGTQHCPDCDLPIRPQTREAILDQILRDFAGRRVALLAPLVVARKGIYPELAAVGAAQGLFRPAGGRASRSPPTPGRAWTAFASTTSTCRWRRSWSPRTRGAAGLRLDCRSWTWRPWTWARGWSALMEDPGRCPGGAETPYSTQRACPGCGRAFPEPDPRLFSYNSKHGWCPTCFGTGEPAPGLRRGTERRGGRSGWSGPAGRRPGPCPTCHGASACAGRPWRCASTGAPSPSSPP